MITAFIVTVCIPGLIFVMALAKLAGDADKQLDELYQAVLLREEHEDGNRSEKVHKTA
jgi:hypothetical protein